MAKVPVVNKSLCTSCGLCTEIAPKTLKLDDDDLAEVYNPTGDPEDVIQEAIDSCPIEAITWKED
jgi:ferredoxin